MARLEPATKQEERREGWKRSLFRWLVFVELLALFGIAHLQIGSLLISQTNRTEKDLRGGDQLHNMRLATETRADLRPDFRRGFSGPLLDFFPHRTDGVVQPLWPWVAAWFAEPGHTIGEGDMAAGREIPKPTQDLFQRGRWFHVFMTLTFLALLGIAACRIFSLPAACNLILLGGFGALLPRSAFFQPEPLYFVLFFLTWVACISALQHNSLWIYGLIGVVGGLAYLAKGSVSPLLAVFVGVSSLRCAWEMIAARRRGFHLSHASHWHWRNHLVGLVVLAGAHLITIGPRLKDSYEKFGDPFHSFPAYWMWLDNFQQAYEWMDKHNTPDELAAMLPSERPSFSNYLRTHSIGTLVARLRDGTLGPKIKETGTIGRVREFFWPQQTKLIRNYDKWSGWRGILEWRGLYLLWLALILAALIAAPAWTAPGGQPVGHVLFLHGSVAATAFVAGSFLVYSLAYGFYAPIARGSGDRFMLSLYLPLAFSLIWGAESVLRRIRRRKLSPWIARGYLGAQWILFAALAWRIIELLQLPKFYPG